MGGCCGCFCGSGRSSAQGSQGRGGPSFSGQPHPKDRWGTERLEGPVGAEVARGWARSPSRQPRVGWGLRSSFSVARERAEPFPQDQRATCSPRPSYPRILFLLSHRERRVISSRGGPRVEPRRPGTPRTWAGEEESEGSALLSLSLSSVCLTQRPSRPPFWERGEKKKEEAAAAGGGENGREGTGAATSSGRGAQPAAARARWRRQRGGRRP